MIFVVLSLVFSVALAADRSIPACAHNCFDNAIASSGCATLDYLCQCTTAKNAIISSVTTCMYNTTPCSARDLAQVQPAVEAVCAAAKASAGLSSPSASGASAEPSVTYYMLPAASATASSSPSSSAAASSPPRSSSTLSAAAKAGIGIGAGLACLLLLGTLMFFLVRRRRRRSNPAQSASSEAPLVDELDSTERKPPAPAPQPPLQPQELEAVEKPVELRDTSQVAELPGSFGFPDKAVEERNATIASWDSFVSERFGVEASRRSRIMGGQG